MTTQPPSPLRLSERITCLPVVHGSGNCALAVRKWLLEHPCDCLAVGLPESFRSSVLEAVEQLPVPSIVLQPSTATYGAGDAESWQSAESLDEDSDESDPWSYVPIDPCQPVIMALRIALGERWPIEFCDLETNSYQPQASALPDSFALSRVPLEKFATAILPSLTRPFQQQILDRLKFTAWRLHQLQQKHEHIVVLCSILEWPWLREAFQEGPDEEPPLHDSVTPPTSYAVNPNSLIFLLGELPYITGLY